VRSRRSRTALRRWGGPKVEAFTLMNVVVLLFIVCVGDFCIREDLHLADDFGIVGFIDHWEAAFAQLLLEHPLSLAQSHRLPFQLHTLIIFKNMPIRTQSSISDLIID
jgi:hypothetical protein